MKDWILQIFPSWTVAVNISELTGMIDWFDTEGDVVLDSTDIVDDTTTDCVANDDQENDDENKI